MLSILLGAWRGQPRLHMVWASAEQGGLSTKEAAVKGEKFVIQPHFRLQEWVAEEKGYFRDEGLDYVFEETVRATEGRSHDQGGEKSGAYQTFERGRTSDVSCACHWT